MSLGRFEINLLFLAMFKLLEFSGIFVCLGGLAKFSVSWEIEDIDF